MRSAPHASPRHRPRPWPWRRRPGSPCASTPKVRRHARRPHAAVLLGWRGRLTWARVVTGAFSPDSTSPRSGPPPRARRSRPLQGPHRHRPRPGDRPRPASASSREARTSLRRIGRCREPGAAEDAGQPRGRPRHRLEARRQAGPRLGRQGPHDLGPSTRARPHGRSTGSPPSESGRNGGSDSGQVAAGDQGGGRSASSNPVRRGPPGDDRSARRHRARPRLSPERQGLFSAGSGRDRPGSGLCRSFAPSRSHPGGERLRRLGRRVALLPRLAGKEDNPDPRRGPPRNP